MTLLAPNGKPSNLNPQQWELVRTPDFKAWFGDWEKLAMAKVKDPAIDEISLANLSKGVSRVVDENGEPKVMFHYARRLKYQFDKFYVFRTNKQLGSHFGTISQVENLSDKVKYMIQRGEKDFRLYEVFLNIRNPIRMNDRSYWENQDLLDRLAKDYNIYEYEGFFGRETDAKEFAKKNGIDGIIYLNKFEIPPREFLLFRLQDIGDNADFEKYSDAQFRMIMPEAEDSWIAFDPEQIKLADGTNTTFDFSNPDIRYDGGGSVETPDEFYGDVGVGALIYCTTTNRFLLLHRGIEVQEPNTWGMVSGKVDDDDSHLEYAVSREVEEELDVVLNRFTPTYIFRKGDFTFHNHFAFVDEEFEPRLNWENQDYMWVSLDEFPDNLHFGLKILMEKVDFRTFQPKEQFAEGGPVNRDVYTSKDIKKVYVSIRIKYDTKREDSFGYKSILGSMSEEPFMGLSNGVLDGVIGVSTSSHNVSEWLVHRECLVMMPFDEFVSLNKTEQIQYYDADYLSQDGLRPFFRLYDRKGTSDKEYTSVLQNIFPKIAYELELDSLANDELSSDYYAFKTWFDVYVSAKFIDYVSKQPRINRPEDFVEYAMNYWKSGQAQVDYYYGRMPEKITAEDLLPAITRGIVNAGKIYDSESEWLILNKSLVIPPKSSLFFVVRGYDNMKSQYEALIDKYNLRSLYKINYVNQKDLNEFQQSKAASNSQEYQKNYEKGRSEMERRILKAYKDAQNDLIDSWTNKLQIDLSDYFDNRTFRDSDGNQYGTDVFEVPSVRTYYDSLILKFADFYDAQAEAFVKNKDKYIVNRVLETFRQYLNRLESEEGTDELEAYTDYAKVYKYHILEKLRYLILYDFDISNFGKMIKRQVGSDLYRYFQKDEIRLKSGGVV